MKMKVVQCWDDGVVTDIRLTEILRKYNAKATFNLNPGLMKAERQPCGWTHGKFYGWSHKGFYGGKIGIDEMTEIYAGFEVATHNWRHENAGQVPDDVFIKSATDTRKFLEDKFQRECRGYAWPCGLYTPSTMAL
ncbi:MAG: polysaccharide deacetylase family protein, partial [Victivallales bacterium]|nr:polysaccharide deacetylase family protein [Victivallales bacterium]